MILDSLWPNGPKLIRSDAVLPMGTDAVLLSAFAGASRARTACDLGCGSGIIAILLAWNNPGLHVCGLDIQPQAVEIARQNTVENGLHDRVEIRLADLRCKEALPPAGSMDLTVANPPYFPAGSGKTARTESLAVSRDERNCTLEDVCHAAAYLTKWGGKFAMVHRPERLAEVICALSANGLEPKRLRLVQHRAGEKPNLFLIEARRGGNPGLEIEPPLILEETDGSDTNEIKRIYHR